MQQPEDGPSPEPAMGQNSRRDKSPEQCEATVNGRRAGLRAFRWGWTAFMVVATSVPYLLNWLSTPAGYHYTWIVPPYFEDSLAYQSWSQQAAHGSLLFQIKYTALPQSPFLFHPFFLVCGWLSALFACDIGVVHWVMKAVGVGFFLAAFFRYVDYLGLNRFQSIAASILVGISSGMGWFLYFLGCADQLPFVPADLQVVDMNTYWSLLWNPLFPYSLALMLLTVHGLDRGTREARKSDFWFSGLMTGGLALIHPYSQPLLFVFAVVITTVRRRADAPGYLCRYFSAVLPFVLYVGLVAIFDPVVSQHSAHGEMKSPPLASYAIGFGFPLLLCVGGLVVERGRWLKQYWQVALWFLLPVTFSYLPLWFQKKLIFGAHLPLCILAGIACDRIRVWYFGPRTPKWVLAVVAAVLLPLLASTPMNLLVIESREVKSNPDGAYYINNEVMAGLKFLKDRTRPNEVVFATLETSRLIPAFAGNTVVWGHWAMAVDFEKRESWFNNLLDEQANRDDDRRSREFWGTDIQYIFADGVLKQALGQNSLAWRGILGNADQVFTNGSVVIYKRRDG